MLSFVILLIFPAADFLFAMNIPMEKGIGGHRSIGEMLSGLIFDQEMRACCENINQYGNGNFATLNCSAIKDGVLPVANGGYANPNYYAYFWNCISRQNDYRNCCADHGVSAECLPICNSGKNHPSYEEMNILLAKSCFKEMSETLSTCIAKRRGKIVGAQIILHLDKENGI